VLVSDVTESIHVSVNKEPKYPDDVLEYKHIITWTKNKTPSYRCFSR